MKEARAQGSAGSSEARGSRATPADAEERLGAAATLVEAFLERALPPVTGHTPRLAEALRYGVLGGGKRLRPALVFAAAEACGRDPRAAVPVAAAVEMIHAYSLVHDDLPAMDDDDFRRGRPTLHRVFGEALAILAGDALLTLAFEILATAAGIPERRRLGIVSEIAAAAGPAGLVAGQVADLEAEGRELSLPELEFIHTRKTGALILASVRAGGLAAEADAGQLEALGEYARRVGLGFQIVDDLLDVEGDPGETGKSVGRDRTRRKATYPGLFGAETARRRAAELIEEGIAHLGRFGPEADPLRALARFVGGRRR